MRLKCYPCHETVPVACAPQTNHVSCADEAMTIRLPEKWTRFLVRQPESGMGYQRVDVRLANNREIKDAVVFNAEEIELPGDCAHIEIEDIQLHR